jgi:hypothetical protein
MDRALYRYLRIMELRRKNLYVAWCTRCSNEIIYADLEGYPLREGLGKCCREVKK